ncbi:DNA-binding transcriptional regulator AraC [Falsiruegeria litorea R37]|uniref:DNA-binding transcriptional regulator AraC n=1 Tax=Falsiruegeria litorea R37 TaxID=1200284 RepID=A0A1Y5SDP7_9RHOB|nr:AraC family transcriptional regulator [Falsiruegeria litorea]SLN37316.1 DNA-binding transcriptional regulator AraC [Falsiruegeria litorea R37]
MAFNPIESPLIRLRSLAQMTQAGHWQLELPHDRSEHALIWLTRGQGTALLDGAKVGLGAHNAMFVPSRNLMAVSLGRQALGNVLLIPPGTALTLPEAPLHLRILDGTIQAELTSLFDAILREQASERPLSQSAMLAYCGLVGIWLRRNIETTPTSRRELASRRLSRRYFTQLTGSFSDGGSMADHAASLGVTPTHLTRVCKAETGETAASLLTGRILHAAHQLLGATEVPMQDIARHLGFGSAAYFTTFIQQHTGQSPRELRRSIQIDPASN